MASSRPFPLLLASPGCVYLLSPSMVPCPPPPIKCLSTVESLSISHRPLANAARVTVGILSINVATINIRVNTISIGIGINRVVLSLALALTLGCLAREDNSSISLALALALGLNLELLSTGSNQSQKVIDSAVGIALTLALNLANKQTKELVELAAVGVFALALELPGDELEELVELGIFGAVASEGLAEKQLEDVIDILNVELVVGVIATVGAVESTATDQVEKTAKVQVVVAGAEVEAVPSNADESEEVIDVGVVSPVGIASDELEQVLETDVAIILALASVVVFASVIVFSSVVVLSSVVVVLAPCWGSTVHHDNRGSNSCGFGDGGDDLLDYFCGSRRLGHYNLGLLSSCGLSGRCFSSSCFSGRGLGDDDSLGCDSDNDGTILRSRNSSDCLTEKRVDARTACLQDSVMAIFA
ncbi:hypothetical protein B0T21DRAFT_369111, partial [Apiosordaria backusii]